MKLSTASFLLLGAGIAQTVVAAPIRVVVVTNEATSINDGTTLRYANAIAVGNNVAQMNSGAHHDMSQMMGVKMAMMHKQHEEQDGEHKMAHRQPCGKSRGRGKAMIMKQQMHDKAIEIANSFRKTFGLPLIEVPRPTEMKAHFIHGDKHMNKSDVDGVISTHQHFHNHHNHNGRPGHWEHLKKESFMRRVHAALMQLGPWEGRAVAFVLGCGIGVLIRMFWVLTVVSYRSITGSSDEDDEFNPHDLVFAEEIFVAPPHYTFVDEKSGDVKPKVDQE